MQVTPGRVIRALFATALLLNGGAPAMPVANGTPIDATQSQHHGHGMTDVELDGEPAGQPPTDCCDDGSMDCQCGCIVSQPGASHLVEAIRAGDGAPEPAVAVVSRHPSNPITTPFRPPA